MTPLPPNAAIEAAAMLTLRERCGYKPNECDRTFDGRPGGRGSKLFIGVWSSGERTSGSRVALDERFGVNVTVTVAFVRPDDRRWEERDRLELEINRVRAILHGNLHGHAINARANQLAGLGSEAAKHTGFSEALHLLSVEPWQEKSGEWFNASTSGSAMGVAQTIRFGGARLFQAIGTAV